jgi:hypothetical protein
MIFFSRTLLLLLGLVIGSNIDAGKQKTEKNQLARARSKNTCYLRPQRLLVEPERYVPLTPKETKKIVRARFEQGKKNHAKRRAAACIPNNVEKNIEQGMANIQPSKSQKTAIVLNRIKK